MRARAVIDPVTLTVLAVAGLIGILVPNARPWNWAVFQKKPPTQQLVVAQQQQVNAQAMLDAALAAQKDAFIRQIAYAQETLAGIQPALAKAPQGPEVILASSLAGRASIGLSAAIGDLPASKQTEIELIVNQALSAKQAEIDAANAKLKELDAQLQNATTARIKVEAQIPALREDKAKADAKVDTVTKQVVAYADKAAEKEREAGSLSAQLDSALHWAAIAGIVYLLVHFLLPSVAQEYPSSRVLTYLNRTTKSLFSAHQ